MSKYKVELNYSNGEDDLLDEVFDSEEDAYLFGETETEGYELGKEILEMSNPGDYPYDKYDTVDFTVIEIDD